MTPRHSDSIKSTHLNSDATVGVHKMGARLQEGVVLDLGGVDQDFLAVAVVAVLSSFETLSVLVHVEAV